MRILYFIDRLDTPGGMERVLSLKANYLSNKKYEIGIVVTNSEKSTPFFELNDSVKIYFLNLQNNNKKNHYNNVEKVIFNYDPDLCISLMGNEVYFLHEINHRSKKIVEFHNSKQSYIIQVEEDKYSFLKKFYRRILLIKMKNNLKKYDKFIHLTNEDKNDWGNLNNSIVIQNPITFEVDNKFPNYSSKKIISVGRISHQKGYEYLVLAWEKVKIEFPDWKLTILGRREGVVDHLDSFINDRRLSNEIKVLNAVSNVKDYYYDHSIYVASSRYEGFPMTLLEAASCGLPIVTWKCPTGPVEIINDMEDGLLSEYLNIDDLANKMIVLIKDFKLRSEMGNRAKKNINRFSMGNIMDKWENLFNELYHE